MSETVRTEEASSQKHDKKILKLEQKPQDEKIRPRNAGKPLNKLRVN